MADEITLTVEPDRFDEAMDEFLSRHIIPASRAATIENYAKQRSWWIAGVAQMDVVNDVHASIADAMERGIPFDDWKKGIEEKLTNAWGSEKSHRIVTIFRNATMQAANAGRWEQMHQPHVLAARPYLEHDGIRDSHECSLCKRCNGIVLPADHPWWETMSPILHHCCRCGLRSHRKEEAERRGITHEEDLPDVQAEEGFGAPPNLSAPPKPWKRKKPPKPEIESLFAAKTSTFEELVQRPTIPIKQAHDPEHWYPEYFEKYRDDRVATQLAWGRAVFEMSRELTDEEVVAGLRKLQASGFPGVHGLDEDLELPDAASAARMLVTHNELVVGRSLPTMFVPQEFGEHFDAAEAFWSQMADTSLVLPKVGWTHGSRGRYDPDRKVVELSLANSSLATAVHEYGHAIETTGNSRASIALEYTKARARGEPEQFLCAIFPDSGFGPNDKTRPDKLWHAYAGRIYPEGNAAELIEVMAGTIAEGKLPQTIERDPESVLFFFGWLLGR